MADPFDYRRNYQHESHLGSRNSAHLPYTSPVCSTQSRFLSLAFASTAFFWGQFWGKNEAIAVGVLLTLARRRIVPAPREAPAAGRL